MYLVIKKCVTAVKFSNFSGHYLRNRSTLDIGVLGYNGTVQHKEYSPEVLSIPPVTPCIVIQQLFVLNILIVLHNLRFFSSKCRLYHNATYFGSCIINILNTGVLKFKRKFRSQRINELETVWSL